MKLFNQTQFSRIRKSAFDLSHERKFSANMGDLIPILCEEVVPGDQFKLNSEVFIRMAPMLAPIMHRVNVYTHFFFVPNRLVWNNWEKFITGGDLGTDNPVLPYIGNVQSSSLNTYPLLDYFGIGFGSAGRGINVNALPFRAYTAIWNEYYRDQNLQTKVDFSKGDGAASPTDICMLRKRAWEKDYFTSALPWTQKGGAVSLPLTGDMPVNLSTGFPLTAQKVKNDVGSIYPNSSGLGTDANGYLIDLNTGNKAFIDPNQQMIADADAGATTTIEELRRATKLQQWLEKNARGGSRYIEQMLAHFGVTSSDARLQRPEYLGGGKTPVVISEVLQTSETSQTVTPQGNMAGHGMAVGNTHSFKRYFEEHGYVIGIVSVLPKTDYSQGIRKHFLKKDRFDYYWPEFAQLGEQPVTMDELFAGAGTSDTTFGYQSRYAEYKYIPSSVHGKFKTDLAFWHMSRTFSSTPALNEAFIKSDPTHRVFAVTDPTKEKLYIQVFNNLKAIRPIPYFNNPSLL